MKTKAFGNDLNLTKNTIDEHYEIIPRGIMVKVGGIKTPIQPQLLIQQVEELIRRRSSTDRRMGYLWMVVPILPILMGIGLAVSFIGILVSVVSRIGSLQQPEGAITAASEILALYGFAIVSFYIILAFGAFAIYYMIERRNGHFRRQQRLFSTLQKYLTSKTSVAGNENAFRLWQSSEESILEERDRPAGLWSVLYLFVTPVVGLIVAFNLTQDLRRHEELQANYQTTLLGALNEAGIVPSTLPPSRPHKRDPLLFMILTAITGGLFWIYWFYTLLKDYNQHFQDQALYEDQILALLRPQSPTRKCVTCGGAVPESAKFCPHCGTQQAS
ncbi:MAG: zinc ribbon domain-containing protein [Candidatus Bathyarchaeia archaeon]|jgi:predicted nucleic acid-binding Zn ribbon protein